MVAGSDTAVLMVESEAKELPEKIMLDAVLEGHKAMQPVIKMINEFAKEAAASLANSFIILITGCIALCPSRTASSIIFSGNSFASDSTIRTAVSLPATTRSSSLFSSCVFVGLITYFSSTYPTLDAPTGLLEHQE